MLFHSNREKTMTNIYGVSNRRLKFRTLLLNNQKWNRNPIPSGAKWISHLSHGEAWKHLRLYCHRKLNLPVRICFNLAEKSQLKGSAIARANFRLKMVSMGSELAGKRCRTISSLSMLLKRPRKCKWNNRRERMEVYQTRKDRKYLLHKNLSLMPRPKQCQV